jgi:hypothetical protein
MERLGYAHPTGKMESSQKTLIRHNAVLQLPARTYGLIAIKVESRRPIWMFQLFRVNQRVAGVQQLLPSG